MSARATEAVLVGTGILVLMAAVALVGPAIRRNAAPLPTIAFGGSTQVESCLLCHATVQGLGQVHASLGCSPCHLGDPKAHDVRSAHRGLERLAGDLSTSARTCGQGACHPLEQGRVLSSLMARAPGILAVDRFAFGERPAPDGDAHDDLPSLDRRRAPASLAESHVRKLCGSCHLGARKERPGDFGEAGRGGGCTACHLGPPNLRAGRTSGPLHPEVSAAVPDKRCTGCHSRSGRISLSYRGVVELEPGDARVTGTLSDGRPVGAAPPDVHAKAGMTCIDCHTERELMGDGVRHQHAHEALEVGCDDCHGGSTAPRVEQPPDEDRERVADVLRRAWVRAGKTPLPEGLPLHTRTGTPLWRTQASTGMLALAETGARLTIPRAKPGSYHALGGHERLSCQACHSVWAPRCTICHTRLDLQGTDIDHLSGLATKGRWLETAGGNGFGSPLLAVGPRGRIEPFVEGMKLSIDLPGRPTIERTLWAPLEPHTTGRARSCASCHAPALVEDVVPVEGETTRSTARLLTVDERAKLDRVGRCIPCHTGYDDRVYANFKESVARLASRGPRNGERAGRPTKLDACRGSLSEGVPRAPR